MHWEYGLFNGIPFGRILTIVILIFIIYLLVKAFGNNSNVTNKSYDNSLNILNERFAKGEISEEEYRHKKEIIMESKRGN